MIRVSIRASFGGESLTCVGNAAPPRPTTPACWTASTISLGSSVSHSGTRRGRGTCAENGSVVMQTAGVTVPSGWGLSSTPLTVPDTEACTGTETKPSDSATLSPRSTRSPALTIGRAGLPSA